MNNGQSLPLSLQKREQYRRFDGVPLFASLDLKLS
jgi:hypothetical protein